MSSCTNQQRCWEQKCSHPCENARMYGIVVNLQWNKTDKLVGYDFVECVRSLLSGEVFMEQVMAIYSRTKFYENKDLLKALNASCYMRTAWKGYEKPIILNMLEGVRPKIRRKEHKMNHGPKRVWAKYEGGGL